MNNSLLRWAAGYVNVHMRGLFPERFINMCANRGIDLWDVRCDGDGFRFSIAASDFMKIKDFARKSGIRVRITGKIGLPFFMHANRKRQLLFAGIIVALFLVYFMSFFIWDIGFEGNVRYTDEMLLKYLNNNGYHACMFKKSITCEDIEAMLRLEYNDITWVSARIDGSKLVIAINENTVINESEEAAVSPEDIVSEVDGVITGIITRSGTPMVKTGDTIVKGQTLVSGVLDIYDDSDTIINRHFVAADADIFARTVINYLDEMKFLNEYRAYTGRKRQRYYLMVKDFKLESFNIKKGYGQYDLRNEQGRLCIGESLYLPVRWGKIVEEEYEINEYVCTEDEAAAVLNDKLNEYIEKLIKKGIQIVDKNVKIGKSDDSYILSGEITVIKQIGESRSINTGDYTIESETHEENE